VTKNLRAPARANKLGLVAERLRTPSSRRIDTESKRGHPLAPSPARTDSYSCRNRHTELPATSAPKERASRCAAHVARIVRQHDRDAHASHVTPSLLASACVRVCCHLSRVQRTNTWRVAILFNLLSRVCARALSAHATSSRNEATGTEAERTKAQRIRRTWIRNDMHASAAHPARIAPPCASAATAHPGRAATAWPT
jgi:hypothetical protein